VTVESAQQKTLEESSLVPGRVGGTRQEGRGPVDLRVNGKLWRVGEVVLVDDQYGLRITRSSSAAGASKLR